MCQRRVSVKQLIKILIWGLGKDYNSHLNLLKVYEEKGDIEIVAVTAKDVPDYNTLDSWTIVSANDIYDLEYDYILIFNAQFFSEIKNSIVSMGIEANKILNGKILDLPYFEWEKYLEIYNSRISIISCNCWGGMLYKTLGMECLSPFKNLWVDAGELCDCFEQLEQLSKIEPIFDSWDVDIHSNCRYPVGRIEKIKIHFNHETSWDNALENWNRRVKKINFGNLFLAIYTEDYEVVEKFLNIVRNGKKGVCFVPESLASYQNFEEIFVLKLLPEQKEFYETVNSNVSNSKNSLIIDILSMLREEKVYRVR